ncbi:hypothetical protein DUA64_15610 [Salmonella enterica subsp. enterica serovar Abony]|nr:hypothetical protein [Salmonella enterica subsp. enterica serovar Abony]EBY6399620.1 hypothetical protein [Salmonella enterica subsp. enterica serovar Abony]
MKSLDKNMLKTLAFFCVTFSEKYRDGADVDELKGLVINLSLTMRPDSVKALIHLDRIALDMIQELEERTSKLQHLIDAIDMEFRKP